MKSQSRYLLVEFLLLFIILPVSLAIPYNPIIKLSSIAIGFTYLVYVLIRKEKVKWLPSTSLQWTLFFKETFIKLLVIAIVTGLFVYFLDRPSLFCVPRSNMKLWFIILGVYTFISVWPQEVIYRTFFFARYNDIFKDKRLLIFVNAIVFCLAHLFLKNALVLVLTFIGGLLFAWTYQKNESTILVSIEHALYGNWLFTVGMGEMLAFPGMEAC